MPSQTACRTLWPRLPILSADDQHRGQDEGRLSASCPTPFPINKRMTLNSLDSLACATQDVFEEFFRCHKPELPRYLMKLADHAEASGEISYASAVSHLAERMTHRKAKQAVSTLMEAGWLLQKKEMLSIKGWGTTITR